MRGGGPRGEAGDAGGGAPATTPQLPPVSAPPAPPPRAHEARPSSGGALRGTPIDSRGRFSPPCVGVCAKTRIGPRSACQGLDVSKTEADSRREVRSGPRAKRGGRKKPSEQKSSYRAGGWEARPPSEDAQGASGAASSAGREGRARSGARKRERRGTYGKPRPSPHLMGRYVTAGAFSAWLAAAHAVRVAQPLLNGQKTDEGTKLEGGGGRNPKFSRQT